MGPSFFKTPRLPLYVNDEHYSSSFGRSPQCTSYAEGWKNYQTTTAAWDFPKCDNSSGTLKEPDFYIPPGVFGHHIANGYECCGPCQLDIREIRLVYFPEDGEVKTCSNGTATNGTVSRSSSTGPITPRAAEPTGLATFVSDGYT